MKKLVFRADDLGYTEAFDLGALKAIDEGIVTSGDVMFDAPHAAEILKQLKKRPWISIGWHRHLWERPLSEKSKIPHIVDNEGRFRWRHDHPEYMDEVPYAEAYEEFDEEMKFCYSILGRYPDTAEVQPEKNELEKAFADICEKYGIHVNLTKNQGTQNTMFSHLDYEYKLIIPGLGGGKELVPGSSPYDYVNFRNYDPGKQIMDFEWKNEESIILTSGHPGYLDDHILKESSCNIHRVRELQCIISDVLKKWIADQKIELVNQRDVINGTSEYQDHLKEIRSPLWIGNF